MALALPCPLKCLNSCPGCSYGFTHSLKVCRKQHSLLHILLPCKKSLKVTTTIFTEAVGNYQELTDVKYYLKLIKQ